MPSTPDALTPIVARLWHDEIEPELHHYIAIPARSPAFDPDWVANGHLATAVELVSGWMEKRPIEGLTVEIQDVSVEGEPARTPLIVAEIPAFGVEDPAAVPTVLLYGHLDKQPEMLPWRDGLDPWTPVREGDRLYGRGGADDGYSAYASLAAIEAIQHSGGSHGRCVVVIEASEESGSPDLPPHIEALAGRLGPVDLVICLDSGCADYETLWLTTSLRGLVAGTLTIDILTEGVHSGSASGVVPSTFRILRQLLDRIEDAATGEILIDGATVEIPEHRRAEAEAMAEVVGFASGERFPFVAGAAPMTTDGPASLLARTWRPALSYTGIDGVPATGNAGNVLRPSTALKLSLRIPPTADPDAVREALEAALLDDPPYGATVSVGGFEVAAGWNAPALSPWLRASLDAATEAVFGQPIQLMGEGGTIPFMAMLGERFPRAQFVITGVLGPESNAHGPNEFLNVPYAERLTTVVAQVLQDHALR